MSGLPRITPEGIAVAAAAIALGVLGWSLGYPALSIAAAAAAAALVVTWVATVPVPRIEVSRVIKPSRVERGSPAMGLVAVRNPTRRRTRPCMAVDLVAGDEVAVPIPALRPGRATSVHYQLPTHRRGDLTVGPLAVIKRDPFGLWQGRRHVGTELSLLVHPCIHPLDPRPAGRARHVEGPVSDTAPRGTLTFHSLREYVPGDDVRRIHWRSSARTGTLMMREHVDTSLPSTVVVLDTRAASYAASTADGFEEAVDVAASVVAASQDHGFPVQLVTTGGMVFVVRAGHRGENVREFLATVQPDETGDMQRVAFEVHRGRNHDAIVVVTGDAQPADLSATTLMTRTFAAAALATVRDAEPGRLRWGGGLHLDGPTAAQILSHWQTSVMPRTPVSPPR